MTTATSGTKLCELGGLLSMGRGCSCYYFMIGGGRGSVRTSMLVVFGVCERKLVEDIEDMGVCKSWEWLWNDTSQNCQHKKS